MVGVEEGREFRFLGDLYSQESTFSLVIRTVTKTKLSPACRFLPRLNATASVEEETMFAYLKPNSTRLARPDVVVEFIDVTRSSAIAKGPRVASCH